MAREVCVWLSTWAKESFCFKVEFEVEFEFEKEFVQGGEVGFEYRESDAPVVVEILEEVKTLTKDDVAVFEWT